MQKEYETNKFKISDMSLSGIVLSTIQIHAN